MVQSIELRKTPLYEAHVAANAKMVPFAGFAMPVQYPTGIRAEHEAVRHAAGLFDVSHMGEFRVRGPGAAALIGRLTTRDAGKLAAGQAHYCVACLPDGGIVDDLIVYRLGPQDFRLVVNASNIEKDWAHFVAGAEGAGAEGAGAELENESERIALLALQGPRSASILQSLTGVELETIRFYHFRPGEVAGIPGIVSRTGYTGEDGFELYVPAAGAMELWEALLAAGDGQGLLLAGLGARDTLRLEMGYALYGNDIDESTSPLEAGLSWLVDLEGPEFVGRDVLRRQKEEGVTRRLRGFRLTERGFPRAGYEVVFEGRPSGQVRSGTVSPTLGEGIGTAYLPAGAEIGDELQVMIRGEPVAGEIARMPFYTDGSLRR